MCVLLDKKRGVTRGTIEKRVRVKENKRGVREQSKGKEERVRKERMTKAEER